MKHFTAPLGADSSQYIWECKLAGQCRGTLKRHPRCAAARRAALMWVPFVFARGWVRLASLYSCFSLHDSCRAITSQTRGCLLAACRITVQDAEIHFFHLATSECSQSRSPLELACLRLVRDGARPIFHPALPWQLEVSATRGTPSNTATRKRIPSCRNPMGLRVAIDAVRARRGHPVRRGYRRGQR